MKLRKPRKKTKIKISNVTIWIIYIIMFNETLYQNKFVIEKTIKFVIETDTHIKCF
jgi:hypothetical protein